MFNRIGGLGFLVFGHGAVIGGFDRVVLAIVLWLVFVILSVNQASGYSRVFLGLLTGRCQFRRNHLSQELLFQIDEDEVNNTDEEEGRGAEKEEQDVQLTPFRVVAILRLGCLAPPNIIPTRRPMSRTWKAEVGRSEGQ
jgi:hypothetical protein